MLRIVKDTYLLVFCFVYSQQALRVHSRWEKIPKTKRDPYSKDMNSHNNLYDPSGMIYRMGKLSTRKILFLIL